MGKARKEFDWEKQFELAFDHSKPRSYRNKCELDDEEMCDTMGSMLGLKAFVAAVLGGIGSIPGAMIGGIAIGLCECFVSAIGLSAWKDAVTFAILIIVLLFKPTGFLGRKVQEKV